MTAIQCQPQTPFANPTTLTVSADQDVPLTASYQVRIITSSAGKLVTVPSGRSHWIRNEGGYNVVIGSTGPSDVTLDAGDEIRVSWVPSDGAHKIAFMPGADTAMSGSSAHPIGNSVVKAYVDGLIATVDGLTVVDTLADLRAVTTGTPVVLVTGHTAANDGGGGVFQYLGAVGSAADDDDGWHVVASGGSDPTRHIWGRVSDVITPQMFGATSSATYTAARSASDQATAFQTAVDFWADPSSFSGTAHWGAFRNSLRMEVPSGFYRCESTIVLDPPSSGGDYRNYYVPGEFVMHGSVFTPHDSVITGIRVSWYRTLNKPRLVLSAYKDVNTSTGRLQWDSGTYPTRYLDDTALRTFAASTAYYLDEEIVYTISSVVYVFKCTLAGTSHGTTVPSDVTGTEFTNGTAKFKCTGSCRLAPTYNSRGRSMNDILADNRDVGIWIDEMWEHENISVNVANYLVGLAIYPRYSTHAASGWTNIRTSRIQGSMVGVLIASYIGERMMSAGGRLTLCDFPIGGMVWETTFPVPTSDVGTKYRFNGPAGGEATSGNWSVDTDWASMLAPTWCNDNTLNLHLMYPYWLGSGTITGNKSIYGVVMTSFGASYTNNNNIIYDLSLELPHWTKTTLNEAAQFLMYSACANQGHCRNEDSTKTASLIAPTRIYPSDQSRLNRITSSRGGKHLELATVKLCRGGGYGNLVLDAPYDEGTTAERTVIYSDSLSWSSYDKVYASDITFSARTSATALDLKNYATAGVYADAVPRTLYHAADDSWTFDDVYDMPMLMVDLSDDAQNLALIRLDAILSADKTLAAADRYYRWMAYAVDVDGLAKIDPTIFPAPPVRPVTYSGGWTQWVTNATYKYTTTTPDITMSASKIIGVDPWVKKVLIGIYGEHIRGFRLQVLGAGSARIYSPYHDVAGRGAIDQGMRLIDAPPEKGLVQAPAMFRYRSGTGLPKLSQFAKAAHQKYYCTSGLTSALTPGGNFIWGHDGGSPGSATISEWDGTTTWNAIATNAYYAVPSDFVPLNFDNASISTATANDATPTVQNIGKLRTANSSATTITTFDDGQSGQELTLLVNDANTTISHANGTPAVKIYLASAADEVCASGDVFKFIHDGSHWREIGCTAVL